MFLTPNVPALFKKGTLKLVPNDDGDLRRVAEATCLIEPFPHTLARELGEDIAAHLFDDAGTIREELQSVDLRVRVGLQRITVRHHEGLKPIASLEPVSVKSVTATRNEDPKTGRVWLTFQFLLVFSLDTKATRTFVLDEFGKPLLWSFEALQGDMLAEARMHEAAARLGEIADGDVTMSVPGSGFKPVTFNKQTSKKHRAKAKQLRAAARR